MKYVFGIDKTTDKDNQVIDGHIFHCKTADMAVQEVIKKINDINIIIHRKSAAPGWIEFTKWISFSVTCLMLWLVIEDVFEKGIIIAYLQYTVIFHIMSFFAAASLLCYLLELKKKYIGIQKVTIDMYYKNTKDISNSIQIPEDAIVVELIIFHYKIKKGKMIIMNGRTAGYFKKQFYAYRMNNNLHLTDILNEWSIPLESLNGIQKRNTYEYALCLNWYGKEYELWFPTYELDKMTALIQ